MVQVIGTDGWPLACAFCFGFALVIYTICDAPIVVIFFEKLYLSLFVAIYPDITKVVIF